MESQSVERERKRGAAVRWQRTVRVRCAECDLGTCSGPCGRGIFDPVLVSRPHHWALLFFVLGRKVLMLEQSLLSAVVVSL